MNFYEETPLNLQEEENNNNNNHTNWKQVINFISSRGKDQRSIFISALLLIVYFLILIFHGLFSKTPFYIPVAFIQLMHSLLLFLCLVADYFSNFGPDETHTYGCVRSSIICSFGISLTIILFACSLLLESFKRFLVVSYQSEVGIPSLSAAIPHLVALIIYGFGGFLLRHFSNQISQSSSPQLNSGFLIMFSGFMHSLAHFAVGFLPYLMLSDDIIEQAQPLFHGLVSLFIINRAKEIIVPSFFILMQATPDKLLEIFDNRSNETFLDHIIQEISLIDGIKEIKKMHFWSLTFTELVGSLHVTAKNDVNEQLITNQVHSQFDPIIGNFTVQVEKD